MLDSTARLSRLDSSAPIRSLAVDEGNIQIPLWSVPLVLIVLYVCLFSGLGAFGLVGPDEPRYAAISRTMAETHDWVTPRLWGTPWFEKPVLYYWVAGVAMRIFGVSEFAARLPSALAALLAVLAVAWTALRSYGVGAAWYALLMLPTSVAMIGFSRAASPDMLFAGLLTAAMAVASEMLQKPRPGPLLRIAFGFFLGAAVLAKGPAAVILAGGATLLWAAISRQWRAPFRFLHPLIIAIFCATALPWYVLCALRNPDFLRVFIWQHNFQRYVTPVFEHRQPFWFYAPVVFAATIPWSLLGFTAFRKWDKSRWTNSPTLFALCWAVFPFIFFSFSQSKLPGYILPSIPPVFLMISHGSSRLVEMDRRKPALLLGSGGGMLVVAALLSWHVILHISSLFKISESRVIYLLLFAVLGGCIAVGFSLWKRPIAAFVSLVLLMTALLAFMNLEVLPIADSRLSARKVAQEFLVRNSASKDVAVSLPRDWRYGLNYYLGRELPEWVPLTPHPEWLFMNDRTAQELENSGIETEEISRVSAPFAVLLRVTPRAKDPK
jgi:4-amino-4-deoxy-L-arabinose transferase-like glycosyltransferase